MDAEIDERSRLFDEQFESKFGLKKKGYSADKIGFAQAAMSNMLGEKSTLERRAVYSTCRRLSTLAFGR